MEEDMLDELDVVPSLKVIVVGNGQVGKSSLINRFCLDKLIGEYKKTIGTDFYECERKLQTDEIIRYLVWDTAGQEMFAPLTRSYYRGAGAAIFVFSSIDRSSFDAIESWVKKVHDEVGPIISILVQNKCDLILASDGQSMDFVTPAEAEALATKLSMPLYRMSVNNKTHHEFNQSIHQCFESIGQMFIRRVTNRSIDQSMAVSDISSLQVRDEQFTHQTNQSTNQIVAHPTNPATAQSTNQSNKNFNSSQSVDQSTNQTHADAPDDHSHDESEYHAPNKQSNQSNQSHNRSNNQTNNTSKTFKLQPLTQRTGGKKASACTIL